MMMPRRPVDRLTLFIAVIATVMALLAYVEVRILRAPGALEFTIDELPDPEVDRCPGDFLEEGGVHLNVRRAPLALAVVRTMWDSESNTIIETDQPLSMTVINVEQEITQAYPPFLIPDVPPGDYRLDVIAYATDNRNTGYSIPFRVGGC